MSLRLTPHPFHPTSTTNTSTKSSSTQSLDRGAPSAPGLHDTLRASLTPSSSSTTTTGASQLSSTHPLECRLQNWTATQDALKSTLLRRNFGIAEPLRRSYELKLVRDADSFRPSVLGAPAGVHEEILTGRDSEIAWEDIYAGQDGLKAGAGEGGQGMVGWTEEMERSVGMGKW